MSDLKRRRTITRGKLRRTRKRRTVVEQPLQPGVFPVEHHDVLFVAPQGVHDPQEYFRFPVVKVAPPIEPGKNHSLGHEPGNFVDPPEKMDFYDYGQRKGISISNPAEWGPDEARALQRGPALATLPIKPEPAATSCGICYLLDAQNLNFRNPWTAEEWSQVNPEDLPTDPMVMDEGLDVLLAGPRGKVFRVTLKIQSGERDLWPPQQRRNLPDGAGHVESIDLRRQAEVWNQLRNGVVAGRVLLDERFVAEPGEVRRVVPLVNITSLVPREKAEVKASEEAKS